jgi:uncharacterized protein with FMN-binding domain
LVKRLIRVLGVVMVLLIALGVAMVAEFSRTDRIIAATEVDPSGIASILADLPDGRYEGGFNPGKFVGAKVAVQVEGHQITGIEIVDHNYGQGKPAEKITESVIASQGLAVDSISGATVSSKVILVAIENALRRR